MNLLSSESVWLFLAASTMLGVFLCRSKSPGQLQSQAVCLAGLWGGAWLLSLSLFCNLLLFSLSCFLLYKYSSGQELLPVDQKAVLVTDPIGKLTLRHGVFQLPEDTLVALESSEEQAVWISASRLSFPLLAGPAPSPGEAMSILFIPHGLSRFPQPPGSDSGFGHALAKHLDKLGFTVFAGVLDEKGSGAEELRKSCSERLSVLQMDVTKPEQIKAAHSKVVAKTKDKGLWAVVNNAGIFHLPIDGELIPMTDYKKCMAVNYFGAVEVTKAFLPLLRKSKGRLVNVSSMGGTVPLQMLAAYNSTKAALTMFSSIMRQELSKWGVKVIIIQPGAFLTNIIGSNDKWEKVEKGILDQLPQDVQEDYSQDYIMLVRKNFLKTMAGYSNPDITPVLRDIQQAISAKSPSPLYTPGQLTFLWICFNSYSPISFFDYVALRLLSNGGAAIPRALSMSN